MTMTARHKEWLTLTWILKQHCRVCLSDVSVDVISDCDILVTPVHHRCKAGLKSQLGL